MAEVRVVRPERPGDHAVVRSINAAAFGRAAEADLVETLRAQAQPLLSLVAEVDDIVVGHILFSPVSLDGHPAARLMALAPMAVLPARQRQGIGAALVHTGLERCRELGADAVVVLGHPSFYPRFGFVPAARIGIRCEYDAPDEAFMCVELVPGRLRGMAGTVRFHPAFRGV